MADGWRDVTGPGEHPWELMAPGPELAEMLTGVDVHGLDDAARVSYLRAADQLLGWSEIVRAQALVAVADAVRAAVGAPTESSLSDSCVGDEVAAALHLAPVTGQRKVHEAACLVRHWPMLGDAVSHGRLTISQARVIAEGVGVLSGRVDDEGCDLSERAIDMILPLAAALPPARLRERVHRMVIALDPEAAAERRRRAARELTDVTLWPGEDGLATLAMRGPSPDAIAAHQVIDAQARLLRQRAEEGDDRTLGQWREAALLAALGLSPIGHPVVTADDSSDLAQVNAEVRVVVPLTTLLDLSDSPGELTGFGAIDPEFARELAADGDWVRWVTDSVGDFLIDEGRRRFPGARLGRFLRAREGRCKHPSCGVRSTRCDADHLPAYAEGGVTSAATMSPTCPRHNRHRVASGWELIEEDFPDPMAPPSPIWVSALGRRYETVLPAALHEDYIPLRT